MKRIFAFMLSAFLLASCLPQNMQVPQSPLLPYLERKSGLIGYIGIDGNVYFANQGGLKPTQLTKDAVLPQNQGDPLLLYEYPTWSRDGHQLAFIGLKSDGNQIQSKIVVAHMRDNSLSKVYASSSDHPVYLNWSPDNVNVSFLSGDSSGQNVSLQSVSSQGGDPTLLDSGSPFYYWSWAPNGHEMIVHSAGDALAQEPEHISFLKVNSRTVTQQALDSTSASSEAAAALGAQTFQAPAWSPDGSHIALARITDKETQIIVTDATGKNPKKIGTFTTKTAFVWSGDGTRIAYIDGKEPMDPGVFGSLHIVDLKTSKEVTKDGKIVAFFWSPNGEELAYFNLVQPQSSGSSSGNSTQTSSQLALELHVLDVVSGQDRTLLTYAPTSLFMRILPYFDQYAQSVTIWSPDNNNLVLSLVDDSGNPSIAILPASGRMQPRILAQGYVAFWSWQ